MNYSDRDVVLETNIPGLPVFSIGKVRDVYDLGKELLIIATDRLSAFDVVFPNGIPLKGQVLTQMSLFWFDMTKDLIENHLITADKEEILIRLASEGVSITEELCNMLEGRSMIIKKVTPFPAECIVRGYISGSAWNAYKGQCCVSKKSSIDIYGISLPRGLKESEELPHPIFTPSTKASIGEHDQNIDMQKLIDLVGGKDAFELKKKSIAVYKRAAEYARSRGILIADTKFEFGYLGPHSEIILIDEVLTPDSSRFWPMEGYKVGHGQPSYDKQFVRDFLAAAGFKGEGEPPILPEVVVNQTTAKYLEAFRLLTGKELVA